MTNATEERMLRHTALTRHVTEALGHERCTVYPYGIEATLTPTRAMALGDGYPADPTAIFVRHQPDLLVLVPDPERPRVLLCEVKTWAPQSDDRANIAMAIGSLETLRQLDALGLAVFCVFGHARPVACWARQVTAESEERDPERLLRSKRDGGTGEPYLLFSKAARYLVPFDEFVKRLLA